MIAQSDTRTFYQFEPIFPLVEWWHFALFIAVVLLLISYVGLMYRRDTRTQATGIALALTGLRVFAVALIVLFFLNPTLRSETRIVKSSRLAVLVDTSLSMGLKDDFASGPNQPRRIDEVVNSISSAPTIRELRKVHDVTVYRFSELSQPEPIATFTKTQAQKKSLSPANLATASAKDSIANSKPAGWIALGFSGLALLLLTGYVASILPASRIPDTINQRAGWLLAATILALFCGLIFFAVCDLNSSRFDLLTSMGFVPPPEQTKPVESVAAVDNSQPDVLVQNIDWAKQLSPRGTSTRLGDAVQYLVNKERGGPLAGIIVVTDGRSNSGLEPTRAIAAASNAGIPVYPVGIGTTKSPQNVAISDIQVPPRVFPDDKFQVKGLVQAYGMNGKTIRVELVSVDEKQTEAEFLEDETTVRLLDDGQTADVQFEVQRQEQGKRRYILRTAAIEGDLDPRDNQRGAVVEIVDRKTTVLMIAGGPTREFRFLRNQFYRDKDINLHVWLQTAERGADQEADELLFEFPQTRDGMYQYDAIIAFDPDWRELDENQADLLERWVAEKAGGLIAIAGPVYTPEWTRRPRGDKAIDMIRRLYPVAFYNQGSAVLKLGRFGGDTAYPLGFTREGRAAEYLWLADTASENQTNWARFEGVFGYYAVNEAKPGADVLANFADPSTSIDERLPIYLASQYYGAGRTFFQASGEMWRIRTLDVDYFQQYYIKLLRWASQGRLLRDSTRGVLLADRSRCWMGDQVVIQAILRDAQDEPMVIPEVRATILTPDGNSESLTLRGTRDTVHPGAYNGQFTVNREGEYKISLPVPDSPDLEILTTVVESNIPDLEKERPQRNDALLTEVADLTQGHYYVGMSALDVDRDDPLSPVTLIQPQDQETYLPGTPDRFFKRRLAMWLLGLIAAALCFEWTIRRLHKLA